MAQTISSDKLYPSLSDIDGLDQPRFDSRDFDVCDDKPKKLEQLKSVTHSDYPQNFVGEKTYSPKTLEQPWQTGNEVESLIQSHISRHDELNVHGCIDTKPNNSRTKVLMSQYAPTSESQAFNTSDACRYKSKMSDDLREERRLKTNSSFQVGQILNRKAGSVTPRTKSPGELDVENVASFSRTFKRQSEVPSNSSENAPEAQVKTKLKTIWNNMKYGWRIKREVNLKLDSATWLLGQCYHNKSKVSLDGLIIQDVVNELKNDLSSRILLTYRINFPTIPGTDLVTDSGWGCMLRCGQMMMAQALVCHFLQREWRISSEQPPEKKFLYKMILRWFGDSLSEHSPFSLHNLVLLGKNYGRKAGDWYGPTHAAQVLRDALIQAKVDHSNLIDVCMYVALDGIVFKQDVMELCSDTPIVELPAVNLNPSHHCMSSSSKLYPELPSLDELCILPKCNVIKNSHSDNIQRHFPVYGQVKDIIEQDLSYTDSCPSYTEFGPPSFNTAQSNWKSLILFVSVRLGNDKVNPFYIPCLKSLLAYENCIGIIGGRPKHALYFIGYQEDKLIHMDPHSCQPAIDVEKEDFNEKSFHSSSIRTMSFSEMDPSCAIGFYFRKKEDFLNFIEKFSEITAPMKKNLDYPVFALAEGKRKDIEEVDMSKMYCRPTFSHNNSKTDEDDYILL